MSLKNKTNNNKNPKGTEESENKERRGEKVKRRWRQEEVEGGEAREEPTLSQTTSLDFSRLPPIWILKLLP